MKKVTSSSGKRKIIIITLALALIVGGVIFALPRLNGAQDCTSVEHYDVLRDQCYFDCDSDKQCDALSKKVDEELNQSFKTSTTKSAPTKPVATEPKGDRALYTTQITGSETKGTVYTVQADGSILPDPSDAHKKLWDLVTNLIGAANVKQHIISFEVFNDAKNDTEASVWRSDNPVQWHMNLNEAFADDKKNLIRTIIHEYGHVLTLSGGQVDGISGACPRIQLDEGCGNDGSYINTYYNAFWKDNGFAADKVGSISESDAADLYAQNPTAFVSDYASTNITEDIAESFADFVTKSNPSGTEVKDQKVQSFYKYPELVALRQQIRAAAAKVVL